MFRLHSTDIAQVTLTAQADAANEGLIAPAVCVKLDRTPNRCTPVLLESGDRTWRWASIPPMGAAFCQQRLFKEKFACVVRKDHPRIDTTLSLKQFETERHLAIATSGTGHGVVEKAIEAKKIRRKVGLTVPSFLGIVSIITSSDYIAIVPERLGKHFASAGNIRALGLALEVTAALPDHAALA